MEDFSNLIYCTRIVQTFNRIVGLESYYKYGLVLVVNYLFVLGILNSASVSKNGLEENHGMDR